MDRESIMKMEPGRELDSRTKTCDYCEALIKRGKKESNRDWFGRRYCSIRCKNRHFNNIKGRNEENWIRLTCSGCQKEFEARKIYHDRGQYKYCSVECKAKASRKHPVKEFNEITFYFHEISGYYVTDNGLRMNRVVWEYYNGPIPDYYVVHHLDEDKANNDISNLALMEWGEHTRHHHSTGVKIAEVICIGCGSVVSRKQSEIKKGQNKYCSRECSNLHRARNINGTYYQRKNA